MSDELLHFEDFPEGEIVWAGSYEVTVEEIKEFASEFDPQPFHLDEELAKTSVAGELSASGWHTSSMAMRMMCDGYINKTASMGSFGVEDMRWLRPVLPGDVLRMKRTTLATRRSQKRPDMGILTFRWQLYNQHEELKLDMRGIGLVAVREPAS